MRDCLFIIERPSAMREEKFHHEMELITEAKVRRKKSAMPDGMHKRIEQQAGRCRLGKAFV
jgi:hypothetical protein